MVRPRECPVLSARAVKALVSAVVFAAAWPTAASAQMVASVERQLLPFQVGPLAAIPPSFWTGLTFLRTEEDRQRSLKADITFGLSGDEAGSQSVFKLNTGISLSRDVFPSEVSVVSKLGLQLRDGQLQEDVTSLQITYDYHANHYLQYFAFAERFTDSFLSIQQRYEIGFGGRVGKQFGRSGAWQATDAHFAAVESGLPAVEASMRAIPATRSGPLRATTTEEFARFRSSIADLRHSLEDRQARLFIGLVASVFAEIERAELEVVAVPVSGSDISGSVPVKTKVALGAEQRYRLNLRPTLRFRPAPEVLITVFPYFKLPLDGPRWVTVGPDGRRRLDYRRDVLSEMSWSIKPEQTGLENVELVFTFNQFFDNAPPSLPQQLIDDVTAQGRTLNRVTAESTHRLVALSLKLRW